MNIKAVLVTLILGSSSLAFADHLSYKEPTVRDHRWGYERPVLLANDTHLMGRAFIKVTPSTRPFTKLELRSNNGRTSISKVIVELGNGQRQIVAFGKVVSGKQSLTIDLPGNARYIKSVMLLGDSRGRATLDVLAI
jgi:hypothetical protein